MDGPAAPQVTTATSATPSRLLEALEHRAE